MGAPALVRQGKGDGGWRYQRAARQELVDKLRTDAEAYQQLVDMNQAQVEAVVAQLHRVVDESAAQSNRCMTRMTLVAIGVGTVVAIVVGLVFWILA